MSDETHSLLITHYSLLITHHFLLRNSLHRLAERLRPRIHLHRVGVALFRFRFFALLLIDHAEVVVGAGEIGLVFFWFVGEVLLQRFFAARVVHAAQRGDLSDAELHGDIA